MQRVIGIFFLAALLSGPALGNSSCSGSNCLSSYAVYDLGGTNLYNLYYDVSSALNKLTQGNNTNNIGYNSNWGGSCAYLTTTCSNQQYGFNPYGNNMGYSGYGNSSSGGYGYNDLYSLYSNWYGQYLNQYMNWYNTYFGGYGYGYPYQGYGSSGGYGGYGSYGYGNSYGYGAYPYFRYNRLTILIDIIGPTQKTETPTPEPPPFGSCGTQINPCPSGPTDRPPVNDPPDSVIPTPPDRGDAGRGFTGFTTH